MKSIISSLCLLLAAFLLLSAGGVDAQTNNYVLVAYDSALDLHRTFEQYVEDFRKSLNVEASDFGLYFTDAMANAIARADSFNHGAALQSCAGVAAQQSREAISRFDEPLIRLQDESVRIHLTVYQELIDTNIKESDLELFYYYHSYKIADLYANLYDELLEVLYTDLYALWAEYFVILGDMENCIAAVFA